MAETTPRARSLPSLLTITLRRGLITGRAYLVIGTAISLLLTVVLLRTSHGSRVFAATFPLEIPLFASLGATGGLMLFVADRSKGVLEYLISYGIRPRSLFLNSLLVTVTLSSIVLGSALLVGLVGYIASGNPITAPLEDSLLGYTIPMTYACSLLAATCGIIWSSLSTPRMGMNSPVGIAPMLGVAPPVLVLVVAQGVDPSAYYYVTVGAAVGFLALTAVLLLASSRLMGRERYLSPM